MSHTINESIHSWHEMKIESSLLVHSVTTHSCDSVNAFQCFRVRSKVEGPKEEKWMISQQWTVLSQTERPFRANLGHFCTNFHLNDPSLSSLWTLHFDHRPSTFDLTIENNPEWGLFNCFFVVLHFSLFIITFIFNFRNFFKIFLFQKFLISKKLKSQDSS